MDHTQGRRGYWDFPPNVNEQEMQVDYPAVDDDEIQVDHPAVDDDVMQVDTPALDEDDMQVDTPAVDGDVMQLDTPAVEDDEMQVDTPAVDEDDMQLATPAVNDDGLQVNTAENKTRTSPDMPTLQEAPTICSVIYRLQVLRLRRARTQTGDYIEYVIRLAMQYPSGSVDLARSTDMGICALGMDYELNRHGFIRDEDASPNDLMKCIKNDQLWAQEDWIGRSTTAARWTTYPTYMYYATRRNGADLHPRCLLVRWPYA